MTAMTGTHTASTLERQPTELPIPEFRFPSATLFDQVCREGFSVVRPLLPAARDPYGWNFGRARPPSYAAYGRMRFLLALSDARALKPSRVLEVAAGDAALSACLQEMGCEVMANDLRREHLEAAVALFKNGHTITLVPGDLFALSPIDTGLFDLIAACEVIEHLAHPIEFLAKVRQFLTPRGQILLTTPNGLYFRNKIPTYSDIRDFDALESRQFRPDADGHLFLFTPSELAEVAQLAGLRVAHMRVWGTPLLSGESGARLLCRLFTPRMSYWMETSCQRLPQPIAMRISNSISAVLSSQ